MACHIRQVAVVASDPIQGLPPAGETQALHTIGISHTLVAMPDPFLAILRPGALIEPMLLLVLLLLLSPSHSSSNIWPVRSINRPAPAISDPLYPRSSLTSSFNFLLIDTKPTFAPRHNSNKKKSCNKRFVPLVPLIRLTTSNRLQPRGPALSSPSPAPGQSIRRAMQVQAS